MCRAIGTYMNQQRQHMEENTAREAAAVAAPVARAAAAAAAKDALAPMERRLAAVEQLVVMERLSCVACAAANAQRDRSAAP